MRNSCRLIWFLAWCERSRHVIVCRDIICVVIQSKLLIHFYFNILVYAVTFVITYVTLIYSIHESTWSRLLFPHRGPLDAWTMHDMVLHGVLLVLQSSVWKWLDNTPWTAISLTDHLQPINWYRRNLLTCYKKSVLDYKLVFMLVDCRRKICMLIDGFDIDLASWFLLTRCCKILFRYIGAY